MEIKHVGIFKLNRYAFIISMLSIATCLSHCTVGIIYSDITQPLVTNMRETPQGINEGSLGTKSFTLPGAATNLSFTWNSRAIGDAAKQAGLTEIYYADLRTVSVLLGLWQEKTVLVYGK